MDSQFIVKVDISSSCVTKNCEGIALSELRLLPGADWAALPDVRRSIASRPVNHEVPPQRLTPSLLFPPIPPGSAMAPALLYVTSFPDSTVSETAYHEWYDDEHLPARLKVPGISSALRFKNTEAKQWLGLYDLDSPAVLESKEYLAARAAASDNELALAPHLNMDRRLYKQIYMVGRNPTEPPKTVLVVEMTPYPSHEKEFHHYYETFHIPQMADIPGWVRSRRYELIEPMNNGVCKFIAIHDFDRADALPAEKQQAIKWRNDVIEIVAERARSIWESYHAANEPSGTRTVFHDGIQFNVRIDGKEGAPVIALCNALGTNLSVWDKVVEALSPRFRIIRHDQRGHGQTSQPTKNTTFKELSNDLVAILNHFKITKVHALIGVSMGAMVAVDFAARFPDRAGRIVVCDGTPYTTPDGKKQWHARIDLIQQENGVNKLADATADRWFTAKFKDNPANKATHKAIRDAFANTAPGAFIANAHAMDDYSCMGVAKNLKVPALLVCGAQDYLLPMMKELAASIPGTSLAVIEDCGHLPMVEQPEQFVELLNKFV
jgi:3-oxoadipate enol-lactonase